MGIKLYPIANSSKPRRTMSCKTRVSSHLLLGKAPVHITGTAPPLHTASPARALQRIQCFKQLITLIKINCQDEGRKTGYFNVLNTATCGLCSQSGACQECCAWEQVCTRAAGCCRMAPCIAGTGVPSNNPRERSFLMVHAITSICLGLPSLADQSGTEN